MRTEGPPTATVGSKAAAASVSSVTINRCCILILPRGTQLTLLLLFHPASIFHCCLSSFLGCHCSPSGGHEPLCHLPSAPQLFSGHPILLSPSQVVNTWLHSPGISQRARLCFVCLCVVSLCASSMCLSVGVFACGGQMLML